MEENPRISAISREEFLSELVAAKQRVGSARELARRLDINDRQLYRWCDGIGPTHKRMVDLYYQLKEI